MHTFWILAAAAAALQTPAPNSLNIHVRETAGIRRNSYPVNAKVPFQRGALKDAARVRLMLNDREVAVQAAPESRWPDGSIQTLFADFNASIGPLEGQTYRLEYGNDVKAQATARGLLVKETADAIEVGNVRFNKTAVPLAASVNYRQQDIAQGANGITVTDAAGNTFDLSKAEQVKVEIVKPGPLYVVLRYTGRIASTPFTLTTEMPNSKTWVKFTATVEDSGKRFRELSFQTPLAFGSFPWLWDFGTGSWSYGVFRNAADSMILTQVVKAAGENEWQIRNGTKGQEQLYEMSGGPRPKVVEGWGHFQDAKEAVAFGFDKFGREPGTYTISLDGAGQALFKFAPAQPAAQHQITIYEHFVAMPVPIGAVTSPVSMLNPLAVRVDNR